MGVRDIHRMHVDRGFWSALGITTSSSETEPLSAGVPMIRWAHTSKTTTWDSLGICMIGGIDADGKAKNNFTQDQFDALKTCCLACMQNAEKQSFRGIGIFSAIRTKTADR